MNCYKHREREAVYTCNRCGERLCQECSFEVDGQTICKDCVSRMLKGDSHHRTRGPVEDKSRISGSSCRCHKNWGLLLFFSFIMPGINYMYLGLIKRGLFIMSSFFLLLYCLIFSGSPLFGFAMGILWVTSIFDGFNLRQKINAGMPVEDSVSDITDFFAKNKYTVIPFILGLFAISVLAGLTRHLGYYVGHGSFPVVLVIVLAGIYLISKKRDKKRKSDDIIDKRNE